MKQCHFYLLIFSFFISSVPSSDKSSQVCCYPWAEVEVEEELEQERHFVTALSKIFRLLGKR